MSRIDDAVRRILRVKFELGLFEKPNTHFKDYPKFGSEEFANESYLAASEGITLLKNNTVLPLLKGIYEESGMNSFLSNSTYRITFAANNMETANRISQLLGNKTAEQIS